MSKKCILFSMTILSAIVGVPVNASEVNGTLQAAINDVVTRSKSDMVL